MNLSNFLEKWKEWVSKMNEKGIPMPTIRDPKTGLGSVSLTLVFISFNFCLIALVGKWSGRLGGVDPSQALNLFMVCAGLYWSRKMTSDKSGIKIEKENDTDKQY